MLGLRLGLQMAATAGPVSTVLTLSGTPPQATQTVAYNFTPGRSGGTAPFTYSITAGTLPTGLTLNTSTGVISGTPSVVATSSGITLHVVDSTGTPQTFDLTGLSFTVSAVLTISGTPGAATNGSAYSFTPTSTGGRGTKVFSLTGTLPTGLSFSTSTGAITGTPTVNGTTTGLNITVTDADLRTASLGTFSLVVSGGATTPGVVNAGEQPASSTTATTLAANTLKSVPAGRLVIFWVDAGFQTPTNVTDSVGNTYAEIGTQNQGLSSQRCSLYGAFITNPIVAGVTTFTVNSPVATSPLLVAYDFPSALVADKVPTPAGNAGPSATIAQNVPALTNATEILIMGVLVATDSPIAAPSGWNLIGSGSSAGFGMTVYWKNATVTTSDTSFSMAIPTGVTNWVTQYATFTR